mmetsp:Transcript_6378/g.9025  ORF Transcript_6378/g.9025 Transcript_6378/m.9025 type:complete len:370 (-) Transcript_6378:157-1266(-)
MTATEELPSSSTSGTPWVERYRPTNLKEVSHQTEVVSTLQNAVATGRLPHLLFYGPPGTGKTSVALALCRQLWHPSQWRRRVLELNASDERGISVVRDKIKHFASLTVGSSNQKSAASFFTKSNDKEEQDDETNYPNPPFKIIILDEADTVTPDAQAALRRVIEAHSRITRFVLICNYVTRIIEPLASRCAKFRFQSLPPASMKARLVSISESEKCNIEEDTIDDILEHSQGDMRRAVTTLQSIHALGGSIGSSKNTQNKMTIAELAGLPPTDIVDDLWTSIQSNRFSTMEEAVENVGAEGFSAQVMLHAISAKVIESTELNELSKAELSIRIAEAEKNMIDGADEQLQLMSVCSLALTCWDKSKLSKK